MLSGLLFIGALLPALAAPKMDAAAFNKLYSPWLQVVDSTEQVIDRSPWPKARYRLFSVRVLKPTHGVIQLGYRFTRVRPDSHETEVIERQFELTGLPRGAVRDFRSEGHLLNVGDALRFPVPLEDPWGRLEAMSWLKPGHRKQTVARSWGTPCEPPSDFLKVVSPILGEPSYQCHETVLANLSTRRFATGKFKALQAGELPAQGVRVHPASKAVTQDLGSGVERSQSGKVSSSSGIEEHGVWLELRVGDWVSLGVPLDPS